jgi:hypothetical protein
MGKQDEVNQNNQKVENYGRVSLLSNSPEIRDPLLFRTIDIISAALNMMGGFYA